MSNIDSVETAARTQAETLYHMLPEEEWLRAMVEERYAPQSLTDEGFIHLSPSPEVLLVVANSFYVNEPGTWVVLLLDPHTIAAPVQWDAVGDDYFPHIYGPLNLDAVTRVVAFPRDAAGTFLPPIF